MRRVAVVSFLVVAEKRGPLMYDGRPVRNPFLIRDIFDTNLRVAVERRTWEIEARDEAEVRRLFKKALAADIPEIRGFSLVTVQAKERTS